MIDPKDKDKDEQPALPGISYLLQNMPARRRANIEKLIGDALAIEQEDAKEAGALGYMARALTQATMPHSKTDGCAFERSNGLFHLTIMAPPRIGLPYGSYPRLLLAWATTEAVLTKTNVLQLGPSLSQFMAELGLLPTGGRWGTIHRLRDQMKRLFTSTVSWDYTDQHHDAGSGFRITSDYKLWWDPQTPEQAALWGSTVTLSLDFFKEIIDRPVPIDLRALRTLKRSPMALDIYCWLTYRLSYLKKRTLIPWPLLQLQFGAHYARERDFKQAFLEHLDTVRLIYPKADALGMENGLLLKPSPPHVPQLATRRTIGTARAGTVNPFAGKITED